MERWSVDDRCACAGTPTPTRRCRRSWRRVRWAPRPPSWSARSPRPSPARCCTWTTASTPWASRRIRRRSRAPLSPRPHHEPACGLRQRDWLLHLCADTLSAPCSLMNNTLCTAAACLTRHVTVSGACSLIDGHGIGVCPPCLPRSGKPAVS